MSWPCCGSSERPGPDRLFPPARGDRRWSVRSGIEGTINECVHGHGMRRCRYRGPPKAHLVISPDGPCGAQSISIPTGSGGGRVGSPRSAAGCGRCT
ncbi:hypothetical protein B6264_25565 [Kitasatospora aureofaciens]|nr:hypothetical protein B6264_25565 [Kitasatospora aureofaciens]